MLKLLGKTLGAGAIITLIAALFALSGLITLWTLNTLGAHFLNATAPYNLKTIIASGILFSILRAGISDSV